MNELITTCPVQTATDKFCRQCGGYLGVQDRFCGQCGTASTDLIKNVDPDSGESFTQVAAVPAQAVVKADGMETINAVLNNRMAVIGIIALVGPLGLPVLWFSSRFTTRTKIITTTAYVLVTTVIPLAILCYWMEYSLRPLVDVFGQ